MCFFFFKQKTAYEMRISDWSSDVCSSDLYRKAFNSVAWSNVPVPADRANASWREKESQFSQELQLTSGTGSTVKWVLGLYYLNGKAEYTDFAITGTTVAPLQSLGFRSKVTTESGAAFGQATGPLWTRSEEHTSELQSLMRISYAV